MLNVDEAVRKLESIVQPVGESESLPLKQAVHRILSRTFTASINLPPFDCSAMDGYALNTRDMEDNKSPTLEVVGESRAGHPFQIKMQSGQTVRIFTGAALPAGADAVILQENVTRTGNSIAFNSDVTSDMNIRRAGIDVEQGQRIARAGQRLDPFAISRLAACGIESVTVFRKIRVAIFSTGEELKEPRSRLECGQIYDSNRIALSLLLDSNSFSVMDLGCLPDDPAIIGDGIKKAAKSADVILTSGGVSVGDSDFTRIVLEEIGQIEFWNIALKPGKPLAVGKVDGALFFGLPGNPVSAIITYLLFVTPALDRMSGMPVSTPMRLPAIADLEIVHKKGRREYQRGIFHVFSNEIHVRPTGDQSSNRLSTFDQANCLIEIPEFVDSIGLGTSVLILPLPQKASHVWQAVELDCEEHSHHTNI